MNKDKKVSTLIAVILLILILASATFAYFQVQGDTEVSTPTTIQTATTDSLVFEVGKDINITADMSNFAEGAGNRSDTTFAKAILKANNKTNSATNQYNLFFIIEENGLKHTTEDNKPELLLKITRPDDTEVLSIDGLSYKTVTDGKGNEQSGFDITSRTGGFKIAGDYLIEAEKEKIQNWNIEVILVNLDADQTANGGKVFSGRILITKADYETYKLIEVNNVNAKTTPDTIRTELVIESGTTEIDKYYFAIKEANATSVVSPVARKMSRLANIADEKLEYFESDTPTYTFNNLKYGTTYKIYAYTKDKLGYKSNVYETEIATEEYEPPKITKVDVTSITHNSISVKVTAEKGTNNIVKYHFIKDGEKYSGGQTSNTYTYSGLNELTQYNIKIKVEDSTGRFSTEYIKDITTNNINFENLCKNKTFGSCIATNYKIDSKIYYHSASLTNGAGDSSYRYTGANPSNYVCFGTNGTTCDNDHLYRIIGVFNNQLKLIKADFATKAQLGSIEFKNMWSPQSFSNYKGSLTEIPGYYWTGSNSNKVNYWASSPLNTNALNKVFLGNFSTTWKNKIVTTAWKVGGNTWNNLVNTNAKTSFTYEITNPATGQTAVNNKIGLMYVSDYYYAAPPKYWTYPGFTNEYNPNSSGQYGEAYDYRAAIKSNWLYSGIFEWLITRTTDGSNYNALIINSKGEASQMQTFNNGAPIRPVFYLNTTIKLTSGIGSQSNPYRIS